MLTNSLYFCFRHVHLVTYIIYLWIEWIQWGFVIRQGMHVAINLRFDIIDLASNQVKPCVPKPKFHVQDVLTFIFFSSPILKSSCLSTLCLSRALYQPPVKPPPNIGMCPEVSLVLAQLQTSWACRIVLHGSEWIQGYSNSFSMSYK